MEKVVVDVRVGGVDHSWTGFDCRVNRKHRLHLWTDLGRWHMLGSCWNRYVRILFQCLMLNQQESKDAVFFEHEVKNCAFPECECFPLPDCFIKLAEYSKPHQILWLHFMIVIGWCESAYEQFDRDHTNVARQLSRISLSGSNRKYGSVLNEPCRLMFGP